MNQAANSLLQLVTLAVGIAIGVLIAPRFDHKVSAQVAAPQNIMPQSATPPQGATPTLIPLQNYMGSPAVAANILLAGQLQADRATVNGYDLLLLDQNIVGYLASLPVGNQQLLQSIGTRSKATTLYTLPQSKPNEIPKAGVPTNGQPQPPR